jgi:dipeptidyl aminopeptidase/acylaminoacyl peptidase
VARFKKSVRMLAGLAALVCAWMTVELGVAQAAPPTPPPLAVYGALPKTEDLALSPSGKLVALINTIGDKRMLTVSAIDGGAPLVTDDVGDAKISGLQWAGDQYVVVYAHETTSLLGAEQEISQGVLIEPSTKKIRDLLPPSRSYLPAIYGRYGFAQVDGHWYGYYGVIPRYLSTGNFKHRYPDLYQINFDSGEIKSLASGNSEKPRWVVDAAGRVVAWSEYHSDTGAWAVFHPDSPSKPIATGHADFGFAVLGLGRTPGTVVVSISDEDEAIKEMRLDNGQMDEFLPAGRVVNLSFSPATHALESAQVIGEEHQIRGFDPILDRHLQSIFKAFPGKYFQLTSVSADLNRIVVEVAGGDVSGTWQLVDFAAKKARPLADARPDIPDGMTGDVKEITYKAADGLNISAILTLPPGQSAQKLPLVVLPHGGPEAVDRPGFDWWAQAFASRGYAVLQPNFRGSYGYGAGFRNAGFGEWGRKMQTDVSDGIGFLGAQGVVDPKRVCIVGADYGGYVALAGVTLQHGIYRCAASYGGVSDPEALLIRNRKREGREYRDSMTRYWEKYLGVDSPTSPVLDAISPLKHAAQADAPILLIHGVNDTVVPIDQSEDMEYALTKAGKQVGLVRLEGEDHWLSGSATRLQMLTVMVAFVEKYNPPDTIKNDAAAH